MTNLEAVLNILASIGERLDEAEHNRLRALEDRRYYIVRAHDLGASHVRIAEAVGISKQRVGQIVEHTKGVTL
jgi:hypothetical protein